MNGRLATLDEILALLNRDPDLRESVDNPVSMERATFLTFGTVQFIFVEELDEDAQPTGVSGQVIHAHADAESAAACHAEGLLAAGHEVAEQVAMSQDPTVALSRLMGGGEGFMIV